MSIENSYTDAKKDMMKGNNWLYVQVHDVVTRIYDQTTQEERRILLGKQGYEAFKNLDYWLGHA